MRRQLRERLVLPPLPLVLQALHLAPLAPLRKEVVQRLLMLLPLRWHQALVRQ